MHAQACAACRARSGSKHTANTRTAWSSGNARKVSTPGALRGRTWAGGVRTPRPNLASSLANGSIAAFFCFSGPSGRANGGHAASMCDWSANSPAGPRSPAELPKPGPAGDASSSERSPRRRQGRCRGGRASRSLAAASRACACCLSPAARRGRTQPAAARAGAGPRPGRRRQLRGRRAGVFRG